MKPFYDVDGITIYHADCADVMPLVPPDSVGLLLTDPPYGVGYQIARQLVGVGKGIRGNQRLRMGGKPPVYGDNEPFDPVPWLVYGRCVLFGATYYADQLPPSGGWLVWDKTGGGRGPDNTFADAELAWSNVVNTPRVFRHLWKGLVRDSETSRPVIHPTQKPVALMRWIVEKWTEPDDLVFDPYMGSGPIARACADLGRRYIGVEIVEEYCQAAVNRLGQMSLTLET